MALLGVRTWKLGPSDWTHGYDVPLLVNLQPAGGYLGERFHRPWQEIYRASVSQLDEGGVMQAALKYRDVASKTPRHNH